MEKNSPSTGGSTGRAYASAQPPRAPRHASPSPLPQVKKVTISYGSLHVCLLAHKGADPAVLETPLKFARSKNHQKEIKALKVAMKALLLRSGSVTAASPVFPASAGVALSRHDSLYGVFSGERTAAGSPRITLHLEVNRRTGGIRRALSESDAFKSVGTFSGARSMSSPSRLPEEVHVDSEDEPACLTLDVNLDEMWKRSGILVDDVGFCSGGSGKGSDSGGYHGSGGGFGGPRRKMGEYYREMLKSNPGDPLLLRNYGKYLHEVERDFARAEEYYGRAILASPGDGEVLSLYGKLIWETQRDGRRARSYFDRAVRASSEDCSVLGSYAHFMWESEEDADEEEEVGDGGVEASPTTSAVAF